jgi:hypothetical protein
MNNQVASNLIHLLALEQPTRPIVYESIDRCLCGASLDLEVDTETVMIGRVRQPDGSRPLRIIRCSMCPTS